MKIFPAIDIKDKKCVRLIKGDFSKKTEYISIYTQTSVIYIAFFHNREKQKNDKIMFCYNILYICRKI